MSLKGLFEKRFSLDRFLNRVAPRVIRVIGNVLNTPILSRLPFYLSEQVHKARCLDPTTPFLGGFRLFPARSCILLQLCGSPKFY